MIGLVLGLLLGQHDHSAMMATPAPKKVLVPKGGLRTQEQLEQLALERNPRLGAAKAMVDAASGRVTQAGLYPNPSIGAVGEHVSPVTGGGAIGGFVEQRIVTGGKLRLSREIASWERAESVQAESAERLRVLTMVRLLYVQVLGDQALVEAREESAAVGKRTAAIAKELANVGQMDNPDVLAAANEGERLEIEAESARAMLEQSRTQLGALVGEAVGGVEGKLEEVPALEVDKVMTASPELQVARIEMERSKVALKRAQVEVVPDVVARGGVRNNREMSGLTRVGPEGIFDISVQLPIFNRNQGGIAAAKAEAERARYDSERVKIDLSMRLAAAVKQYRESAFAAQRYKTVILPQAEKAVSQYMASFQQMAAAYPSVLLAQKNLAMYQDAYVRALVAARQAAVEVEGMVLVTGR